MGGGGSKGGAGAGAPSPSPHGALSVVPAWSAGAPPLAAPRLPPRKARRTLEQHTLKAPALRAAGKELGAPPGSGKSGFEKSDVVVMASPADALGCNPAPKLGQLKGMLQNGLIEQSDYDERKRQLLDGMILEEFDDVLAIADRALADAAAIGLSPAGSLGVEPGVLLKTARARLLVKPLDEDLDPWDRQRWWESNVGREERLLKLFAGTDTLSWHAISSGEKLGEIRLRDCTLRRTTTRPRGQGTPGFVLTSRGSSESEVAVAGAPHRTECHVRMLETDTGGEMAEFAEFEDWMDALAPFLPRQGVGVSLRFLQRFIHEHPQIVSSSATAAISGAGTTGGMTSAEVYKRVLSQGLLVTESYVERLLRDPSSSSSGPTGKQPHEIGPTTTFVSHCHDSSFSELVATLAQTELRAQKADQQQFRCYYWIDIFCQEALGPKASARARTEQAKERAAIRRAFDEADVSRSGSLAMHGFAAALAKVGVNHPDAVLRDLLASLDMSGSGTLIELPEFEAVVSEYRKTHPVSCRLVHFRSRNCLVLVCRPFAWRFRVKPMQIGIFPCIRCHIYRSSDLWAHR